MAGGVLLPSAAAAVAEASLALALAAGTLEGASVLLHHHHHKRNQGEEGEGAGRGGGAPGPGTLAAGPPSASAPAPAPAIAPAAVPFAAPTPGAAFAPSPPTVTGPTPPLRLLVAPSVAYGAVSLPLTVFAFGASPGPSIVSALSAIAAPPPPLPPADDSSATMATAGGSSTAMAMAMTAEGGSRGSEREGDAGGVDGDGGGTTAGGGGRRRGGDGDVDVGSASSSRRPTGGAGTGRRRPVPGGREGAEAVPPARGHKYAGEEEGGADEEEDDDDYDIDRGHLDAGDDAGEEDGGRGVSGGDDDDSSDAGRPPSEFGGGLRRRRRAGGGGTRAAALREENRRAVEAMRLASASSVHREEDGAASASVAARHRIAATRARISPYPSPPTVPPTLAPTLAPPSAPPPAGYASEPPPSMASGYISFKPHAHSQFAELMRRTRLASVGLASVVAIASYVSSQRDEERAEGERILERQMRGRDPGAVSELLGGGRVEGVGGGGGGGNGGGSGGVAIRLVGGDAIVAGGGWSSADDHRRRRWRWRWRRRTEEDARWEPPSSHHPDGRPTTTVTTLPVLCAGRIPRPPFPCPSAPPPSSSPSVVSNREEREEGGAGGDGFAYWALGGTPDEWDVTPLDAHWLFLPPTTTAAAAGTTTTPEPVAAERGPILLCEADVSPPFLDCLADRYGDYRDGGGRGQQLGPLPSLLSVLGRRRRRMAEEGGKRRVVPFPEEEVGGCRGGEGGRISVDEARVSARVLARLLRRTVEGGGDGGVDGGVAIVRVVIGSFDDLDGPRVIGEGRGSTSATAAPAGGEGEIRIDTVDCVSRALLDLVEGGCGSPSPGVAPSAASGGPARSSSDLDRGGLLHEDDGDRDGEFARDGPPPAETSSSPSSSSRDRDPPAETADAVSVEPIEAVAGVDVANGDRRRRSTDDAADAAPAPPSSSPKLEWSFLALLAPIEGVGRWLREGASSAASAAAVGMRRLSSSSLRFAIVGGGGDDGDERTIKVRRRVVHLYSDEPSALPWLREVLGPRGWDVVWHGMAVTTTPRDGDCGGVSDAGGGRGGRDGRSGSAPPGRAEISPESSSSAVSSSPHSESDNGYRDDDEGVISVALVCCRDDARTCSVACDLLPSVGDASSTSTSSSRRPTAAGEYDRVCAILDDPSWCAALDALARDAVVAPAEEGDRHDRHDDAEEGGTKAAVRLDTPIVHTMSIGSVHEGAFDLARSLLAGGLSPADVGSAMEQQIAPDEAA